MEDRWKIIEDVVMGKQSVDSASKASDILKNVLKEWVRKYNESGRDGLKN